MELTVGRLSGPVLTALLALMRTPARSVAVRVLRSQLGIERALGLSEEDRGSMLSDGRPLRAREAAPRGDAHLGIPASAPWQNTCEGLKAAYRSGKHVPRDVVVNALERARSLARRSPGLPTLHLEDEANALAAADESARRLERG